MKYFYQPPLLTLLVLALGTSQHGHTMDRGAGSTSPRLRRAGGGGRLSGTSSDSYEMVSADPEYFYGSDTASLTSDGSDTVSSVSADSRGSSAAGVIDARVALAESMAAASAAVAVQIPVYQEDLDGRLAELAQQSAEQFADRAALVALSQRIKEATAQRTTDVDAQLAEIAQRVAPLAQSVQGLRTYVDEQLTDVVRRREVTQFMSYLEQELAALRTAGRDDVAAIAQRAVRIDEQLAGVVRGSDLEERVAPLAQTVGQLSELLEQTRQDAATRQVHQHRPLAQTIQELKGLLEQTRQEIDARQTHQIAPLLQRVAAVETVWPELAAITADVNRRFIAVEGVAGGAARELAVISADVDKRFTAVEGRAQAAQALAERLASRLDEQDRARAYECEEREWERQENEIKLRARQFGD